MPTLRNRLPKYRPPASPAGLSGLLIASRGWTVLKCFSRPADPDAACPDWLALDLEKRRSVLVTAVPPEGRFRAMVNLLGDPTAEKLVRDGGVIEVHSWSGRADGRRMVEVYTVDADDYPKQEGGT